MEPVAHRLSAILLGLALAVAGIDAVWAGLGHFDLDLGAYAMAVLVAAVLAAGAAYYGRVRREPALSAMLGGTAFLCAFSAGFSVLTYFLLTIAGPRIDGLLAQADTAMGLPWPMLAAWAGAHPAFNAVLKLAYVAMLPMVAFTVVMLGCSGRATRIYEFCLAVAAGAIIAAAFWTAFPSFGAFSVYTLPPALAAHLQVVLDQHYAQSLVALLAHGPGRIAPDEVKGLIGFPSYHAVLALLVIWYLRDIKLLRVPVIGLNLLVLASTPVQGGHHVVDVLGGFAVAAAAVAIAQALRKAARRAAGQAEAAPARPAAAALAPNI